MARLYAGQISSISDELVRTLTRDGDIEVENVAEVKLDLEAVLKEFLRLERDVLERAKDRLQSLGMPREKLGRVRAQIAKERGAPAPDEVLPYLVAQILHILFHSANVTEVYADDAELRKKTVPVIRKYMEADASLEQEVRAKLRNLQEGTANFDIEYAKVKEQLKRIRGLN